MNARTIVAAGMGNVKIASLALALRPPPREAVIRREGSRYDHCGICNTGRFDRAPVVSAGLAFSGRKF